MDIKTLDARVTAMEVLLADEKAKNDAMAAEIAELTKGSTAKVAVKKVEKKVPLKTPEASFKVGGKEYKFKVPSFRIHVGPVLEVVKSEAALKDAEMQKRLVEEKRFGIIVLVK